MGLPPAATQPRRSPRAQQGTMELKSNVNVKTGRQQSPTRERPSKRVCKNKNNVIRGTEEEGIWEEHVVVCMTPGDPSKLILRSYYNHSQTNRVVWNEPPSGAHRVKKASEETLKKAKQQLNDNQIMNTTIQPSNTPDTDLSSISYTNSSTLPSTKKQATPKFGFFSFKKIHKEKTNPEQTPVQPIEQEGISEMEISKVNAQKEIWIEKLAVCMAPGDPSKLILRSYFISNLSGKVVWNRSPKGAKVQHVSGETKKKAKLEMKNKEEMNRAMFAKNGPPKAKKRTSSIWFRQTKRSKKDETKTEESKEHNAKGMILMEANNLEEQDTDKLLTSATTTIKTLLNALEEGEGKVTMSNFNNNHLWNTAMLDLALEETRSSDDEDMPVEANVSITTSSSTLVASNTTYVPSATNHQRSFSAGSDVADFASSTYQAMKDAMANFELHLLQNLHLPTVTEDETRSASPQGCLLHEKLPASWLIMYSNLLEGGCSNEERPKKRKLSKTSLEEQEEEEEQQHEYPFFKCNNDIIPLSPAGCVDIPRDLATMLCHYNTAAFMYASRLLFGR